MTVLPQRGSVHRTRRNLPIGVGSWLVASYLSGGCVDFDKLTSGNAFGGSGGAGGLGAGGTAATSGGRILTEGGSPGSSGGEAIQGGHGNASEQGGADYGGASPAEAGQAGASGGGAAPWGGGGAAGSAGQENLPEAGAGGYFSGPCPSSALDGWASVAGHEFDPAANQALPLDITVTTAEDLLLYAAAPDAYIIRISGNIAAPVVDVSSNKLLIGTDADATLEGGIRVMGTSVEPAGMVSNVAIRNLRINARTADTSTLQDDDDAITVAYAHHVWIDHVEIWDAPGDGLDIVNGSDHVTVSWSKLRFDLGVRRTGVRVGHSDANAVEDTGRLKATFHHNWWMDSVDQRMPRVRFGDVHVFNNYYSHVRPSNNLGQTYCIAAALESRLLVQNNYFDNVTNPHVFFSFVDNVATYLEPTAEMMVDGNTYIGASEEESGRQSGQGEAFTPPYTTDIEPADAQLKTLIRHCAGPQ